MNYNTKKRQQWEVYVGMAGLYVILGKGTKLDSCGRDARQALAWTRE